MTAPPPLRFRLANPPAVFVGREAERARLATALERGPLSFVWGLGGLGKSSLVSAVLHAGSVERAQHTVVLDLRPGEDMASALASAANAVASARDKAPLDATTLAHALDDLLAIVLELVEDGPSRWTIVLDNLHNVSGDTQRTLTQIARYARTSRWVAISRTAPPPTVEAAQTIALGGLTGQAMGALAKAMAPSISERHLRAAVGGASGSPWRLQQLIAGRAPTTEPGASPLLESLDETTRQFLAELAVVEVGIHTTTAAQFTQLPAEAELRRLEQRGVLERSPVGIRVHDVTRSLLESTEHRADREAHLRCASVLAADQDVHLVVDSVRVLVQANAIEELAQLFAERGNELFEPSTLLATARLLRGIQGHALYAWRLRAAVECGDASAAARLGAPRGEDPEELLLWARALRLLADFEGAQTTAGRAAVAAKTDSRDDLWLAARGLEAMCALLRSEYAEALRILREVEQTTETATIVTDACRARAAIESDDAAVAATYVERLERRALSLADEDLSTYGYDVAAALHHCGNVRGAEKLIERVAERLPARPVSHRDRLAVEVRAFIATERGRLDRARSALASLSTLSIVSPFVRLFRDHIDASRRLYAGELAELDALIEQLFNESVNRDDAMTSAIQLGWRLAILRGHADVTSLEQRSKIPPGPVRSLLPALCRQEYFVRRGGTAALDDRIRSARVAAVRTRAGIVSALGASLRDPGAGVPLARKAAETAHAAGFGSLEAKAVATLCEVQTGAAEFEAAGKTAARLAALAADLPSARFAHEAEFFRIACSDDVLQPKALQRLATATDVSPAASRRARSLLGGAASLDDVDNMVLQAILKRAGSWVVSGPARTSWTRDWVIDERTRQVWLPERDEPVELDKKRLLWQLLTALADAAQSGLESVTKEQLVRTLWEVREYHPLRHDNKLQASVKNLRKRIEIDPTEPQRLLTVDDGYCLSAAQPVRRIRRR